MCKTIVKSIAAISLSMLAVNLAWAHCVTSTMWRDGGGNLNVIWQDEGSDTARYSSGDSFREISNKAADDLIKSAERKGRRVKSVTYNDDGDDADCY